MSEVIKLGGLAIAFLGILITLYQINKNSIARTIKVEIDIINIKKDIVKMEKEHEKAVLKIEDCMSKFKKDNDEQHRSLNKLMSAISSDLSGIHGYLKGKGEAVA